ncbi:UNVERIFIED_CONTAM: hypothetical protein Sindi_1084700 [Sesamum indicum]
MSTIITAPIDMIKTRLMLQRESKRVGSYRNGLHCAYQVVTFPLLLIWPEFAADTHNNSSIGSLVFGGDQVLLTEGPRGLYKGGFAIFARLGPQTTLTFILCEKLRELAGLKAL